MLCTNNLINEKRKFCLFCGKEIIDGDYRKKFCDSSCAASYNNSGRLISDETRFKISSTLKKKYTEHEKKLFVKKQSTKKNIKLKDRLIRDGIKEYRCEICGINEWQGKPIVLQLHHINGNHKDNKLENLQLLCPNCHSQTENYCSKNRRVEKVDLFCSQCGTKLSYNNMSGLCIKCFREKQMLENIPDKYVLENAFKELKTYSKLQSMFKVSNKTIKKWLMRYNLI